LYHSKSKERLRRDMTKLTDNKKHVDSVNQSDKDHNLQTEEKQRPQAEKYPVDQDEEEIGQGLFTDSKQFKRNMGCGG
jgi:hypothetical protein